MPALTSCQAEELRRVRATFAGTLADVTTGTHGALNPANWTLTAELDGDNPIAPATVVSVVLVSSAVVDVLTADDLTPGGVYLLKAAPADLGGITGVPMPPDNTLAVVGLTPAAPAGRDARALTFGPSRILDDDDSGDLLRLLKVFREINVLHLDRVDRWLDIVDYEAAPEAFVDLMLADLGNPFTTFNLSLLDKRRLAGALLGMYRTKGTVPGIRAATRFFLALESDVLWGSLSAGDWSLGDDELGDTTVLGGAGYNPILHGTDVNVLFSADVYSFLVKIGKGAALTADELAKATAVVTFMRGAPTEPITILSALPPPATVSITAGIGTLTLAWAAVASAAGYTVFSSPTPIVTALSPTATIVGGTGFVDTVPSGEQRYYVVAARDGSNNNGVASPVLLGTAL